MPDPGPVTRVLLDLAAQLDGPYSSWSTIGPRVSLADRGLTVATSTNTGVRLRFRRPVCGIEPFGLLRHPSLTVTVADPTQLLALIRSRPATSIDHPSRHRRLGARDESSS